MLQNFGSRKLCQCKATAVKIWLVHVPTEFLAPALHILTRSACVDTQCCAPWADIPSVLQTIVQPLLGNSGTAWWGRNESRKGVWEWRVKFWSCNFLHPIMPFLSHNICAFCKNPTNPCSTSHSPPSLTEAGSLHSSARLSWVLQTQNALSSSVCRATKRTIAASNLIIAWRTACCGT